MLFRWKEPGNVRDLKTPGQLQLLVKSEVWFLLSAGSKVVLVGSEVSRKEVYLCVFKQNFSPCPSNFALAFLKVLHVQTATD